MSDPIWPESLPNILRDGYQVGGEQATTRIKMESGPDRVLRTSKRNMRAIPASIVVSDSQAADFWNFYDNSAGDGSVWVLMRIKTVNQIAWHRCRFTSFPSQVPVSPTRHQISFNLETFERYAGR